MDCIGTWTLWDCCGMTKGLSPQSATSSARAASTAAPESSQASPAAADAEKLSI